MVASRTHNGHIWYATGAGGRGRHHRRVQDYWKARLAGRSSHSYQMMREGPLARPFPLSKPLPSKVLTVFVPHANEEGGAVRDSNRQVSNSRVAGNNDRSSAAVGATTCFMAKATKLSTHGGSAAAAIFV